MSAAHHSLRRRFPEMQDRSDIIADAVQRAWRSRDTHNPAHTFAAWFSVIVANAAHDHRSRMPTVTLVSLDIAVETEAEAQRPLEHDVLDTLEPFAEDIETALGSISERGRQVLLLRAVDELSAREVGRVLQMEPGAVDVAFHRARVALRKILSASKILLLAATVRAVGWGWRTSVGLQTGFTRAGAAPVHHLHAVHLFG